MKDVLDCHILIFSLSSSLSVIGEVDLSTIEFYDLCFVFPDSTSIGDQCSSPKKNNREKKSVKKSRYITVGEVRKTLQIICINRSPRASTEQIAEIKPSATIVSIQQWVDHAAVEEPCDDVLTSAELISKDELEDGSHNSNDDSDIDHKEKEVQRRLVTLLRRNDSETIEKREFNDIMEEEFISFLDVVGCLIYKYTRSGYKFYKVISYNLNTTLNFKDAWYISHICTFQIDECSGATVREKCEKHCSAFGLHTPDGFICG